MRKPTDLRYSLDSEPGWRRIEGARGFEYANARGRPITAESALARIKALAIPPAWTDVWICADANGHLQATGRDARGRKQYRYHARWREMRDNHKFDRLAQFAAALPALRRRSKADLTLPGLPRRKVLATIVRLLETTCFRIGNERYAEENDSFGLTTLRNRHVKFEGSEIRFRFKGKSGKQWQLGYRDRRIANAIRKLQELPGQQLFQYLDEEGLPHAVRSQDVNAYIRQASGDNFSSRQFRTWGATRLAATALSAVEPETSQRGLKRQINAVIDTIADRLMNTRAVCRSSYIHPKVFEDFESGALASLGKIRLSSNANAALWMDDDERRVLKWLQS